MQKTTRFNLTYLAIAMITVFALQGWLMKQQSVVPLAYSEFLEEVDAGNVAEVVISDEEIKGIFKEPRDGKEGFVTNRVEEALASQLQEHGIRVTGQVESPLIPMILSWVLPLALFLGVWMVLARRMASQGGPGGMMSIGKSKAKIYVETDTKTDFKDVAGVEEAKEELQEVVAFLKDPASYSRLGARSPKGVLLVGPPGTGKTLMAKAVAGEAAVPFFSISGSEFVEMFVGVGAARVRDLFEQARQKAPCIIFIDELDALGRARNANGGYGGHDEKEQTLNQLLVELDGFDSTSGIVLLAATNRPEILDPALLRAGRFDRQVLVDRPDKHGRVEILDVYLKLIKANPDLETEQVAALTPGFTGADLENLVNEAALMATRRDAETVEMDDFNQAIERIVAGLEKKNRLLNPKEREAVAHHEMGHALVAASLPGSDPVHKVSIIPRGIGALGFTLQRPTEDRYLMTKEELENRMVVLLGGRAAEKLMYDQLSTGAADDLSKCTDIARSMVTRYGMEKALGHVSYDSERVSLLGAGGNPFSQRNYSDETAREIDSAVRAMLDLAFERACDILAANRALLEESAQALLENESLSEEALQPLFARLATAGAAPETTPEAETDAA